MIKSILVVTPCYNAAKYLPKTFFSILSQRADSNLDITYHVVDGGSSDGTIELCLEWSAVFSDSGIDFSYISEQDMGMYDALAKGYLKFSNRNFDIYCYINAGDFFAPRSFRNVAHLFSKGIDWLTGINVKYNSSGDIFGARLPGIYPRPLIINGVFGRVLPCIQQESTFWGSGPHQLIDFSKFRTFRLAGDFYLWRTFAEKFRLHIARCWLGGFTVEEGQLSQVHRTRYFVELRKASKFIGLSIFILPLVAIHWLLPDSLKVRIFTTAYIDV